MADSPSSTTEHAPGALDRIRQLSASRQREDSPASSQKGRPTKKANRRAILQSPEKVYTLFAALLVLLNARIFYSSLAAQTESVLLWFQPEQLRSLAAGAESLTWSAPLDDVFIHFDFARSIAEGHPFEWISGNGYSSGGTSLLYPFVLAAGYLGGYRGLELMQWAAIVACISILGTLLGARRLFRNLPPWTAFLAPVLFLSTGVLNWTLFSGMEVALFLAIWSLCLVLWDDAWQHLELSSVPDAGESWSALPATLLGLASALLVSIRPEAAPLIAIFGFSLGLHTLKSTSGAGRWRRAFATLLLSGVPAACVMVGQMLTNHILTGDSSAAGALA
ncbi:MAG: hypothetical protein MK135_09605, partial [Polyangiaceae bacterium]|nr:hypothetical protein [Polyangiaceae bacterium]